MPVFPVLPILIWGLGWAGASYISPRIPGMLLISHLILMLVSAVMIISAVIRLRKVRTRSNSRDPEGRN